MRAAEAHLTRIQNQYGELRQKTAETDSKIAAQREASTRVLNDLTESEAALVEAAKTLAALPEPAAGRESVTRLRALATDARTLLIDAQSAFDGLQKQAVQRAQRLQAIADELASWTERRKRAEAQLEQLEERQQQLTEKQARLSAQPDAIEAQRRNWTARLKLRKKSARRPLTGWSSRKLNWRKPIRPFASPKLVWPVFGKNAFVLSRASNNPSKPSMH